jgi:hypothetical protein
LKKFQVTTQVGERSKICRCATQPLAQANLEKFAVAPLDHWRRMRLLISVVTHISGGLYKQIRI